MWIKQDYDFRDLENNCWGQATKIKEISDADKKYNATIMIGESDDIFYWYDKLINESKENKTMKKTIKESNFKSDIISFMDANNIKYTRIKLAKHDEEIWIYGNGGQIVITEWEWNRNEHDKDYADMIAYAIMNDSEIDTFYESKNENKTMKKTIKERFEAPRDWDFEEMVDEHGMEYLAESNPDVEPYPMGDFNEFTNYYDDPLEAITRAFFGGRYGFKNDSFSPMDEWFAYNEYGNLISIKDYDINDYLTDYIDEEYFYDWCVKRGYFESEEDE